MWCVCSQSILWYQRYQHPPDHQKCLSSRFREVWGLSEKTLLNRSVFRSHRHPPRPLIHSQTHLSSFLVVYLTRMTFVSKGQQTVLYLYLCSNKRWAASWRPPSWKMSHLIYVLALFLWSYLNIIVCTFVKHLSSLTDF